MLLEHLEGDHPRPPVLTVVALETLFRSIVLARAELPVFLPAREHPFNPRARLGLELFVVKYVRERKKPVNPVRSPLPLVAVASEPAVARSHDLGIELVKMACGSVLLPYEHFLEPAVC